MRSQHTGALQTTLKGLCLVPKCMSSLPIVFINLSKDVERRERMTAQVEQMGLKASRLPAVWWADLPEAEQKRYFNSAQSHGRYFKPLGNGEKGCYCSHLKAWQQLLDSDAPAMVVFEDDVRLLPELPQALDAIAALPGAANWDTSPNRDSRRGAGRGFARSGGTVRSRDRQGWRLAHLSRPADDPACTPSDPVQADRPCTEGAPAPRRGSRPCRDARWQDCRGRRNRP